MGLPRVSLTACLVVSHKKVTFLPTREKNFVGPFEGNPFLSTVSPDKINWHLICISSSAR